ncbi:MAG: c-type cytochrome [Planctomycetes bacterium]|nr:c-type cytochrome [Planctomycetota bacterium]
MRRGLATLAFGAAAMAQQGDRAGEVQTGLPADLVVPAAIVRSPAEELATFRLQPGFRIELVASEPLIADPVSALFDIAGRLWVVEMRSFMRDVDATDERRPDGRIAVLRDRDGDGVMDEAVPFADGLVLPRAVLPLRGGALVLEPPTLWWMHDADGDLRADGKEKVADGFDAGLLNPEHAGNTPLWGLDNWIWLANDARRYRRTATGWEIERTGGGGQWGQCHDDRGRRYFNYNEDWLRCDLVPAHHAVRAGRDVPLPGSNHRLLPDPSVFPIRITPGVNRGYQPDRLKNFVLAKHTAVCGPHVLRSAVFPATMRGDAIVCEPAGHLLRRIVLRDGDGKMAGTNAYEQAEFLASTDERFRPVHAFGGPDGGLYVVDMYRGVIQHKNFVTTFLRKQIVARGLDRPIGLGRVWRILPAGVAPRVPPSLAAAAPAALVSALADPDGWVRDQAQRELVERGAREVAPDLRAMLGHGDARARLHALATLQGLGSLSAGDLRRACYDEDAGVLAFALGCVTPRLQAGDPVLWTHCEERLIADSRPGVRWHLALAMGGLGGRCSSRAVAVLGELLANDAEDPILRGTVINAATGSEFELLAALTRAPMFADERPGRVLVLEALARNVASTRDGARQQQVFDRAAGAMQVWQQRALLRGILAALPKSDRQGWFTFAATPPALAALQRAGHPQVVPLVQELLGVIAIVSEVQVAAAHEELSAAELQRVTAGGRLFGSSCAACHQLHGNGMAGLAPPLRGSEFVGGAPDRLIKIALHGLKGPREIDGERWDLEMPGQSHWSDGDLAAILSFVRRSFGHRATTIAPAEVGTVRAAQSARKEPWTAAELLGSGR